MWAVVLCQELVRDGITGAEVAGGLIAIFPYGEPRRYDDLAEAARDLAIVPLPARIKVPEDEDWRSLVELLPTHSAKFMEYYVNERRAFEGPAPTHQKVNPRALARGLPVLTQTRRSLVAHHCASTLYS